MKRSTHRPLLAALCATAMLAWSSAPSAHQAGDRVAPNFEQTIPNLPGKSLVAVEVEYPPGARHPISRNASRTEPAKLLAVFVVDTDDRALTTPTQSSTHPAGVQP